ncbi:MAG: glycosyltransferase family 4 protein, partial [Planctomycetes bacterium]|nr:glycosyltransferase family 4 protein [Planctomycetota bacterium]
MRILVLNYEFPPLGGGGASVCHFLARELVARGHELDLVTMGFKGLPKHEVIDGIGVHRVPCLRRQEAVCQTHEMITYAFSALPTAVRLVRKKKYDINHTHFIYPSALTSYLLRKITGLPYIVTSHGSDVQGYNPDRFQWEHRLFKPIWTVLVRNALAIGSPSQSLKNLILSHRPETPVTVIPNAIDTTFFKPEPGPKGKIILMVSRLLPRKGFQYVLEALAGMETDFKAVIVGDGPYADTLKNLAAARGLNVRFTGWIEKDSQELKNLYDEASIFALPSDIENFPIALVEAMASGMAVLTSDAGGCPEVVGDAALVVPPRNVDRIRESLARLI